MGAIQLVPLNLSGWTHQHLTNTAPMTGIQKTFLALVAILLGLIPVFLALTGFSTDLRLLQPMLIGGMLIILVAGTLAKVFGALPGLAVGLDMASTVKMIAMTNAKGLMILIVAQQRKALGLIGPGLFIAFVMLAIISNNLISPLMSLGNALEARATRTPAPAIVIGQPAMD